MQDNKFSCTTRKDVKEYMCVTLKKLSNSTHVGMVDRIIRIKII